MAFPWFKAIEDGNEELAASLIEDGASVNDKNNNDRGYAGALHMAASKGRVATTRMLLQKGCDQDSRDSSLQTPLHIAAKNCHALVVRVLMENGADSTLRCLLGSTPLLAAIDDFWHHSWGGAMEVVETMIEFGVDVNDHHGDDGCTPLHGLAGYGGKYMHGIEVLVRAGADIEARNSKGQTPLHANVSNIHAVRSLLSHGADANTRDNEGNTPLHSVWEKPNGYHEANPHDEPPHVNMDCAEAVGLLLKAGADETALDGEGHTPAEMFLFIGWECELSYKREAGEQLERALEILASAPAARAERRWRRRAVLVMCIARHRRGQAQQLDGAAGFAGDNWARVAAQVLKAGMEMEGVFRTIVGYL